jgi:hypothetical protein
MADFATLKTDTLDRVGLPSTDGMATDTTLGKAVNAAVKKIGARRAWPWLYDEQTAATVAGTAAVAFPAACSRLHFVGLAEENDVLDRKQRADLFRFDQDDEGTPRVFAIDGTVGIILAPIPDAVYTLTFGLTLIEPALTAGGQTPLLPVQFHDLIVVEAAKYIAIRIKDFELVQLLKEEADELYKGLDRQALQSVAPTAVRVRQDWAI